MISYLKITKRRKPSDKLFGKVSALYHRNVQLYHLYAFYLKCFCASGTRKTDGGVPEDEENFEEAIKNVNTALNLTKVQNKTLSKLFMNNCFYFFRCGVIQLIFYHSSCLCRFQAPLKTSSTASSVTASHHRCRFFSLIQSHSLIINK